MGARTDPGRQGSTGALGAGRGDPRSRRVVLRRLGVPIGLLAVGTAIVALRRPIESHGIARWALVLGLVSTAFSLGWLIWAAMALERLG
ncbi:hypothetical protein [Microbacterium sp. NIBRBAC000506063]|uniref:hypothetical protein n=1 Tax=Microbacterium sp. NIBRBAC000506063 TaxID=2734618 RepID=UPI001BB6D77A|nr:hypothetical protein [Microbacterium sp. NIBRBAC000506063]QTV79291.1 hypothetical protein KAE78_09695 [Microbacterium sp. NIBRBAC000506063]